MAFFEQHDGTFIIRDSITVNAPIDRCFQLTCAIALVKEELGMNPVRAPIGGFVEQGDTVRWEGWQLGMRHFHVSHISGFERPVFMQDSMLDGRFRTFQHDHHLSETAGGTLLNDEVKFSLPFGLAGRLVARWIMVPHIRGLMQRRFARIKGLAESNDWQRYLPPLNFSPSL